MDGANGGFDKRPVLDLLRGAGTASGASQPTTLGGRTWGLLAEQMEQLEHNFQ
jgi:hypothetical protein